MNLEFNYKNEETRDSAVKGVCCQISSGSFPSFYLKVPENEIMENAESLSLSKIAHEMCPKDRFDLRDAKKKMLERKFRCVLKKLGVEQYKDYLKKSSGKTSKYQFRGREISFLKELVDREGCDKEDIISDAVEVFSSFYRVENMDLKRLYDVAELAYNAMGIDDAYSLATLEQELGYIDGISGYVIKFIFLNLARRNGRQIDVVKKLKLE